jgi:competence protein ComEA
MVLAIFLAIESRRKPIEIPDPPTNAFPQADEIMDRVDPNTADAAALAAIPNIGEKRAAQIVEYREEYLQKHPQSLAFNSIDDLRNIKGFGPASATNLAPFLVFLKPSPTTTDLTTH